MTMIVYALYLITQVRYIVFKVCAQVMAWTCACISPYLFMLYRISQRQVHKR